MSLRKEHGNYLIICALGILVLLGVAGLAVDASYLYLSRLRLQKALDAAAYAAISYRAENGPNGEFGPDNVPIVGFENNLRDLARRVARENIFQLDPGRQDRLGEGDPDITVDYNPVTERVVVSATLRVGLFLLNSLPPPFGPYSDTVSARSVTRLRPANIALVLDASSSMICHPDGDCMCLGEKGYDSAILGCGPSCPLEFGAAVCATWTPWITRSKLTALENAAIALANFLEPDRDRLSIIPFNLSATVAYSMGTAAADTAEWEVAIRNSLSVNRLGTWTNTSDGLLRAYWDAREFTRVGGADAQRRKHFILFTDGAPTAGRFIFTDTGLNHSVRELKPNPFASAPGPNPEVGVFDYIHYAIQYAAPVHGAAQYVGPGTLLYTLPFNQNTPLLPHANADSSGDNGLFGYRRSTRPPQWNVTTKSSPYVPGCSIFPSLRVEQTQALYTREEVTPPTTPGGDPTYTFTGGCLNNLGFSSFAQYAPGATVGSVIPIPYDPALGRRNEVTAVAAPEDEKFIGEYDGGNEKDPEHFMEQYYNATIAYADRIRAGGLWGESGTIYAIGFGEEGREANALDPYQDVFDSSSLKSNFLRRLAMPKWDVGASDPDTGLPLDIIQAFNSTFPTVRPCYADLANPSACAADSTPRISSGLDSPLTTTYRPTSALGSRQDIDSRGLYTQIDATNFDQAQEEIRSAFIAYARDIVLRMIE